MPDGDSFLPRIQSVFYSIFDVRQGPKIVYQVPEGLIAVPPAGLSFMTACNSIPQTPLSESPSPNAGSQSTPSGNNCLGSGGSSSSLISPTDYYRGNRLPSPQKRSSSSQNTLFNFDDISKYVIPPSALCGRIVMCSTKRHRIIGFPVELRGKYQRNYFRYNICFVFERGADLSCYEPIVRKVSRVLTACEEESGFLSSPQTSPMLHAIIEQLYEDLNSYAETSIPIDQFNSIELKIFPFYPNPPTVKDWMVPLALINLSKRVEDNWDLTMAKVAKYIDGVNHVSRIAHLADCDIALTRLAISHLLYYQVIMTIDIFQYSNMYTLRKSIQWLADEIHVKNECGPYVTKPGKPIPDWPKLLHLYSRLKPGKTILEWMQAYDVEELGIDVRRFTSFGVIKGFLRRIHRWPVYLPPSQSTPAHLYGSIATSHSYEPNGTDHRSRKRESISGTSLRYPPFNSPEGPSIFRNHSPQNSTTFPSISPDKTANGEAPTPNNNTPISAAHRSRRASAAEKILEQLRNRDIHKAGGTVVSSPRTSWIHYSQKEETSTPNDTPTPTLTSNVGLPAYLHGYGHSHIHTSTYEPGATRVSGQIESRRHSLITPAPPPSPVISKATLVPARPPRLSRSPSAPHMSQSQGTGGLVFPHELISLLDGDHHTDELGVRFEAGWPLLEQWLTAIGGGKGNGDYGRVAVLYR